MDQNIDFSGSDQIQTPHYHVVHPPPQEISDEVFKTKRDLMKSIQTFLEDSITYLLEKNQRSYRKLDLKELAEYKESLENSSTEIAVSNSNQEKEKPPQDSNIQLLCMHDNIDDLIESALNSKLLSINSQRLDKKKQEVKNVVEQPAERGTRISHPFYQLKNLSTQLVWGYEHPNATLKKETDEIIKSDVEELVPILSENVVTLEDKKECDVPIVSLEEENVVNQEEEEIDLEDISLIQEVVLREKLLSINRIIANIKSLNDNPTLDCVLYSSISIPTSEESDNSLSDNFLPEFKTFCDHTKKTRSGNTTTHADDYLPEYDSFFFEIEPDQERLINIVKNDISDDSSNDPLLEEADLFLALDNLIPLGIENFGDDSEGDIRFLKALLVDDSIPFPNNESSESNFDNLSFPRLHPEPPDNEFDFKSKDTIFNPGIFVESRWTYPSLIEVSCDQLYCLGPQELHILSLRLV
uniref:Reverse transcriptase domain-containing protein n=1 Tax=Tanacetum cinerariifolium TaxID=118510 RepID=A0A6L2L7Y0_TANCI|nr:hypothetical protein [Tanacetum cinerariifolium]